MTASRTASIDWARQTRRCGAALLLAFLAPLADAADAKPIAKLIQQLGDKKDGKRIEASCRLVSFKAAEAVRALTVALRDWPQPFSVS